MKIHIISIPTFVGMYKFWERENCTICFMEQKPCNGKTNATPQRSLLGLHTGAHLKAQMDSSSWMLSTKKANHLDCDWKEKEEKDLSNFVARHQISLKIFQYFSFGFFPHRFFWLYPKLLLQGWQHGGEISVLHPLETGK